jgi:predicted DsbA family dithiol-disulfide isomerase
VDGVPFFIVNGTLALSGAQQPDAFLEKFQRAAVMK